MYNKRKKVFYIVIISVIILIIAGIAINIYITVSHFNNGVEKITAQITEINKVYHKSYRIRSRIVKDYTAATIKYTYKVNGFSYNGEHRSTSSGRSTPSILLSNRGWKVGRHITIEYVIDKPSLNRIYNKSIRK